VPILIGILNVVWKSVIIFASMDIVVVENAPKIVSNVSALVLTNVTITNVIRNALR
jgi:hypothetical protein